MSSACRQNDGRGSVGRPVVQGFVGSMDYIRARKGVILTTSQFTKDALDFVDRIEGKKVVLIGGDTLADLNDRAQSWRYSDEIV